MITYSVLTDHDAVVVRFSDNVGDDALVAAYMELYSDPTWRPGMSELVDARDAQANDLTPEGLHRLAALTQESVGSDVPFKTAVVVSQDVDFGLARMYEAFAGQSESVSVFRSWEEAVGWLGLPAALGVDP